MQNPITVSVTIDSTIDKVWQSYILPEYIIKWNFASDEWHCPRAANDFREGGTFDYRMEAKDGSFGFDLKGTFTQIIEQETIQYELEDGRKVRLDFHLLDDNSVRVIEQFEAESQNPRELQQTGWQMILDNFKRLAEQI